MKREVKTGEKIKNHRLLSLPVAPIMVSSFPCMTSKVRDFKFFMEDTRTDGIKF